ncbi:MAG: FtsX-like permease family protein, partial [Acidobacteriota bacterium]
LLHALAATRRREIAVRRALGAGRSLLVRQMLLEGLVLSLVGGLAGVGLAFVGIRTLPHLAALELPRLGEVAIDSTVLSASLATTLAVGLLAGLAPSLAATRGAQSAPQGGRQTTESPGGRRIRQTLIAGQTALATLAIVASALLVRSLHELRAVEPGFAPDNLLTARIELPGGGPEDKATRITLLRELLRRLEALPGVEQAAASGQRLPLTGGHGTFELYVEGQPRGPRPELIVTAQMVSADYFETLGVPLLRGRRFADDETWESDQAVIVNQTMADRFWPDQDPIGRFIEWSNNDRAHVVGVVGNVRQLALHLEPAAEAYLAWGSVPSSQALVLRTSVAPTSLLGAARREATALMPGVIVHGVASGRGLLSSSYADRLLPVWLTTLLAGLAQGLGLLGLYGVVANSVARKTPEIGLRVALGAWPARIVRWVVGHGLRPVLVGLVLGLAVALVATRALTSQLYGVTATDPLAFLSGAALILATAIAVCAVPARRAARIDPATALRR